MFAEMENAGTQTKGQKGGGVQNSTSEKRKLKKSESTGGSLTQQKVRERSSDSICEKNPKKGKNAKSK